MRFAVLALYVSACASHAIAMAPAGVGSRCEQTASIGQTYTLQSKILGEKRVVNVYVPPDYATSHASYPVLYMPDGGMAEDFPHVVGSVDVSIKNGIIRPVIVVGVENTERRRDLVGATRLDDEKKIAPHAGGSDAFRRFIREELKPFVAAHYRVSGESAVVGESFAGLFVVETFLQDPTLFDGYIAADPSVWWNEQSLVGDAAADLARFPAGDRRLYIATGDYNETRPTFATLLTALSAVSPAGVTWNYEPMPTEHHNTIFPTAALHGIRWLFAAPENSATE